MYVDANVRLSGGHLQGLFDHLDQNGADYATFTFPRPIRQVTVRRPIGWSTTWRELAS
jgi:hypothetical protein